MARLNVTSIDEVPAAEDAPILEATSAPDAPSFDPTADADAPPEPEPATPAFVHFRSAMPELNQFDVMDIAPYRDETHRYLIWAVPTDIAERFARHCYVEQGRINRIG